MKFTNRSKTLTKYKSSVGFTQVLMSLVALLLMAVGIFAYINPSVLGFGNASIVMIVVGAMILVIGMMTALFQDFHFSAIKAWGGALFLLSIIAAGIMMLSMLYEGGIING